jgi:hypothetical protein
MLNFWAEQTSDCGLQSVQAWVINDLEPAWKGTIRLRLEREGKNLSESSQRCTVEGFGREILEFPVVIPQEHGTYRLIAELDGKGQHTRSVREFKVP